MFLKINYHSFIDVITNSSTEIYANASSKAPELVEEFINNILKAGGSDKQAKDLFDIGFTILNSRILEETKYADYGDRLLTKEEMEDIEDICSDHDNYEVFGLGVKSKTKEGEDIMPSIYSLFNIDGGYNG